MKKTLLISLIALALSACDSSVKVGDSLDSALQAANGPSTSTTDTSATSGTTGSTNTSVSTDTSNTSGSTGTTDTSESTSTTDTSGSSGTTDTSGSTGTTDTSESTSTTTENGETPSTDARMIGGNVSLLNDATDAGPINVSLRNLGTDATVQSNGDFTLSVTPSTEAREEIIDITGPGIVDKNITITIPPSTGDVEVNTTVSPRSAPIAFNLESATILQNPTSETRTSVSVPANAFQLPDGSIATGNAEVTITEVDISDFDADNTWAPNLVGIREGMTEPTAIVTFGMSEFHFTQNGQDLQLRPGVEATISMDLVSPHVMHEDDTISSDATDGDTMPLWHFDSTEGIWREEGEVTVTADATSASGFRASGTVSHFSWWNIDVWTPFMEGKIVITLVDEEGNPYVDDVEVESYTTTARIAAVDARPHDGYYSWSNTVHMTPTNNSMIVLANAANRASLIANGSVTGYTRMEVIVENLRVVGYGTVENITRSQFKEFHNYNGDDTVVFEVPVIPQ